jgi:hypothetical protein
VQGIDTKKPQQAKSEELVDGETAEIVQMNVTDDETAENEEDVDRQVAILGVRDVQMARTPAIRNDFLKMMERNIYRGDASDPSQCRKLLLTLISHCSSSIFGDVP